MKTNKITFGILFIALLTLTLASCSDDNQNGNCDSGLTCSMSVGQGETAATTPASLVGEYATIYDYEQANSPFTNGTAATFEITANNELIVSVSGMDCIVLSNPVYRFGATSGNYTFKDDCLHNCAFNVSENQSGDFNEVNIEPLTGTGWLGQFHSN